MISDAGKLCGMILFNTEEGESKKLYVLPEPARKGFGGRLLALAADRLAH